MVRDMFFSYLAGKENLWHIDMFQGIFGEGNGLGLIDISVRVVNVVTMARVKMARLDNDASEGKDITTPLISWIDPNGLVA